MPYLSATLRLPARKQCRLISPFSSTHVTPFTSLSRRGPGNPSTIAAYSGQSTSQRPISTSRSKLAQEATMPPMHWQTSLPAPVQAQVLASNDEPTREPEEDEFWRKIPMWKDVSVEKFMDYQWSVSIERIHAIRYSILNSPPQMRNAVAFHNKSDPLKFRKLMGDLVPDLVPFDHGTGQQQSRNAFIDDIFAGFACSTMSVRLM